MRSIFAVIVLAAAALVAGLPSGCGQEHVRPVDTLDGPIEICWEVCFPEEPECPVGWHAKEKGPCWTCCLDQEE